MNKYNRKLGTSKREQGIVTPKMPKYIKPDGWFERIQIAKFMRLSFEKMSQTQKELYAIARLTTAEKLKMLVETHDKKKKV